MKGGAAKVVRSAVHVLLALLRVVAGECGLQAPDQLINSLATDQTLLRRVY